MPIVDFSQFVNPVMQFANEQATLAAKKKYDEKLKREKELADLGMAGYETFDPRKVDAMFRSLFGNLGQMGATQAARSRSTAASLFGNRANPSAAILGAGNQAQAPFMQALAQGEYQRNAAQQQASQGLLDYKTQLNRFAQSDYESEAARELMRQQLQQRAREFQQQMDANEGDALDWIAALAPLLAAPVTGGTSLAAYGLFPSLRK